MPNFTLIGLAVLAILLAISVTGNKFLFDEVTSLNTELVKEKENTQKAVNEAKDANKRINDLIVQRKMDQLELDAHNDKINDLNNRISEISSEYDNYRTRLDRVANAKPGLIDNKINAAINDFFERVGHATDPKEAFVQ